MVRYSCDAWGNHTVRGNDGTEIAEATHIGNINPIRYRGYYYDIEIGLYYLQTRYYDPTTGRFVTIDGIAYADPESINGLNLYAYCGNNPVMNVDPTGHLFWFLFFAAVIGAVIGGAASTVSGIKAGKTGLDLFLHVLGGAILGGVLGLSTAIGGALGAGVLAATAGNIIGGLTVASVGAFGAGVLKYGLQEVWTVDNASWDWGKALFHGGTAAIQGLLSFGIGAAMGAAGMWESIKKGNGFGSVVGNAIKQAGNNAIKGFIKGTIDFLKSNLGWIILRAIYKSLFVTPWGLLRILYGKQGN